jgi:hypothetical protein
MRPASNQVHGDAMNPDLRRSSSCLLVILLGLAAIPEASSAQWSATGGQADAQFGRRISAAGDVNGDGYGDVVVASPGYDNGQADEGRIDLHVGSAAGLSALPAWSYETNQIDASLGLGLAMAGDVNGDGYDDLLVGATHLDNTFSQEGAAMLFLGSAAGPESSPSWIVFSGDIDVGYGGSVASAGDVNGDGYSDVIVGAYDFTNNQTEEGLVQVYLGSSSGLSLTPDWTVEGDQAECFFGISVSSAGDVNGDGYDDIIIGASRYDHPMANEGRAYVYQGSAGGLQASHSWLVEGNQVGAHLGQSVCRAGDVNGDGYADVIVGTPGYTNGEAGEGRAAVYAGGPAGLATIAAWSIEGNQANASLGEAVHGAGDVNGDGYADVIVGASFHDNDQIDEGLVQVFLGSATGLSATPAISIEGDQVSSRFGSAVAGAGDVDGDGLGEILIGAFTHTEGFSGEGKVILLPGKPLVIDTLASEIRESNIENASYGWSVASAGDINGDGFADVIVGASTLSNSLPFQGAAFAYHGSASGTSNTPDWTIESNQALAELGFMARCAGDVDGDGYDDVIVGAPQYDGLAFDDGLAAIYAGSPAGLSAAPIWQWSTGQNGARLGRTVGTAGDVNGDGFADVIVGAYSFDNGEADEGSVWVFLGSAAGPGSTPSWSFESNQVGAWLGRSAATAADVNGDGFSDVIVGSYNFDNGETDEGRIFVFHGSAAGLSTLPDWTYESNQAGAFLGFCVASAGDVNGDGYSDVVAGATGYDGAFSNEGRAYLFLGSAAGLQSTPVWTALGGQAFANFGISIGSAGDLDGDGYSDIVVGAWGLDDAFVDEGGAFVFYSGPAGVSASPDWQITGGQTTARLGFSTASAGDTNGDGFADLLVGAAEFSMGQSKEGIVQLYRGGKSGVAIHARQRKLDDSGPIARLGRTSDSGVQIAAIGRTPHGRGLVGLECELKPIGIPLDGGSLMATTLIDSGLAGVPLTLSVNSLTNDTAYRWRARLRYSTASAPLAKHSRWFTGYWTGWQDSAFRVTPTIVLGDMDCDLDVDLVDVPTFVDLLLGVAPPPPYPACDAYRGDMNLDGRLDGDDVQLFVVVSAGL